MNSYPILSLSELVARMLLFYHKQHPILPLEEIRRWHEGFYWLKKNVDVVGRPDLFQDLRFDFDGPYPKCQALEEVLDALFGFQIVIRARPEFRMYELSSDMKELWEQKLPPLNKEAQEFVEKACRHIIG